MMIAAVFLVLLRPLSLQCALLLLLLLLGTIATIVFFCSWQRSVAHGKQPIKSVLSGRSKCRVGLRTHHFRSEGFRHSPRHSRRSSHARVTDEKSNLVEVPDNEPDSSSILRKRKVKKRVLPAFYQSVQVTPTRKTSSCSGNPSLHCSMSSSADLSEEEDYIVKSGSTSPAPGDTLPWNLPRHERSKRKIQGGSVLDPAERAVLRIADERDRVQKKTFTKWINQHLMKVRKHINDLYEDLRDGHNLISLLEVLSGDKLPRERDVLKTLRLPRERGRMRFHRLQNVQIALDYLKRRQVKLVNIRNDDITDGNPKLTLGLIWTIILHFQISEIHVTGESQDMTAKERLLLWSKQITEGYVGVRCDNFTTSWRDGRLFNAIIHKYRPDLVDMSRVSTQTNRSNLENAFGVAEQLGVARLLDPEDVDVQSPDEKSVITYVSTLYDAFPKVPEGGEGISPNDIDIKWVEYQNMIKYLSQWIKHNVAVMSDRSFPNNPAELKALYTQYLQFKEHEIPLKENEKTRIKKFYKMLEVWIEFGRIHLPPGHHPNDVEKEWGKLIVAMLEREKSLRPEVERLETLQQIANRVQRDCVHGEDKLGLARLSLQSDVKRLESGIHLRNEAEIAGYLSECENILRQQVVDIQVLLDGKYPFTDQLVRRVSNLRDDLLSLRAQCASLYNKGRTLTTEQTKMMISGITQSLNSGYSQNVSRTPSLTQGGIDTSTFTSSLTPSLSRGLQSASEQSYMSSADNMEPGILRLIAPMHIPKPSMKSTLTDSSLTEAEVNIEYIQDLLKWVEDMQLQLDRSEWGSDMPSVATHLDNHKALQRAIEEFQMSLKEAKLSEMQMELPLKQTYSDKLSSLEKQYEKLLRCSKERQSNLESLHDFVSQATRELIWLNEKEEEEVAFDWSDRNSNISKKRDYHADLMKELDEKEEVIKSVQDLAERLLFKSHPARLTIEAYRAAMKTQWSWILQLCSCVEQHLRDNAVYFEFFSDAKEAMDFLRSLQEAIQRKYSCDRTSSLHRLEDLLQESMEEKEQLLQYCNTVAGLMGRAKNIVQLKPRNPDSTLRSSIPVKAICDYRQIEITIYKEDECVLANNNHRAKWKVINPAGNEAMVPSVCFTVPPPNKEAMEMASKTEELYQNVLSLWHHSHINMKSVASWHCLMADIRTIRHWNVASFKTMLPGEHQQVLSNLQSHFDEFLEDCEESEVFTVADCAQLERDVEGCKEYYQELLKSAEREEHEESLYNHYISEIRNFRMHLETQEEQLIRKIRAPLDRDDMYQSLQRITEQEKKMEELHKFKEDLDNINEKCEVFLRQAAGFPSAQTLSAELSIVLQSMSQVHSMSSIYMDKLKTISLVVKHSQSAEALVKAYESKLYEEDAINSDLQSIETVTSILKQWRTEIDENQEVFHNLEDELQKARLTSDRMFKSHNERDFDLDWHKEKADQLNERWRNIHSQIDSRLRDLDANSQFLKLYKDSYSSLDEWIREVETEQIMAQENKPEDSKAFAEVLNKQKVLVAEIEQKQSQIDECQKYSEQCSSVIKDYELLLMTFRAMVDSQHKSPLKKRKMQSSSDIIQQEFMDLRTRYTALVTLMTQYVKFASETLKRAEEEEVRMSNRSVDEEKREHGDKVSKLLGWMSNVKQNASNEGNTLKDSNANRDASNKSQVSMEEMVTKKEQIAEAIRATEMMLNKHSEKMSEEEKEKAQEQLKELSQAYGDLSQHCSDQPTHEHEDVKATSSADCIWTQAMDGLSNDIIGFLLPTPDLSQPESQMCWDDVLEHDASHTSTTGNYLQELNMENKRIEDSDVTSVSICDVAAAARDASTVDELVVKMIEVKQVSDGLNVTYSGDTVTLKTAFQQGLIPASVYVNILQRQKMAHDHSNANESHLEAMQVNRLILECITKSVTPGRTVHTMTSVHNLDRILKLNPAEENVAAPTEKDNTRASQKVNSSSGNLDNGDGVRVDAEVQCDLMSFSSTLIVLGNRHQFVGLVLPRSNECQFSAASSEYDEHRSTDVFESRLLSSRWKVSAFYIPENSEIVDINGAVQNGYIDVYTADILKSIEIPDEFLDVDHLDEKFSSWLMYRKLKVDGRSHDGVVFTPSETKQLFTSYLMINSYIDPKSQNRVLILDKPLIKMIHLFLEDSVLYDSTQHSMVPWTVHTEDLLEQEDFEVPFISEKAEEMVINTKNYKMNPHHFVPSFDGVLDNNININDDLKMDCMDNVTEAVMLTERPTDYQMLDDHLYIGDQYDANDVYKIPTTQELAFINRCNADSLSMCSEESSHQLAAELSAEPLCNASRTINNTTDGDVLRGGKHHSDIQLDSQFEEKGILDDTSVNDLEGTTEETEENIYSEDLIYSEVRCSQPYPDDDNLGPVDVNEDRETHNSSKRKSSLLIEDDIVLDDEAEKKLMEISDHHSSSLLSGHEPLMMSPSHREEVSPECVLHLEESASLSDVTNSLNGVNNLLADKQDESYETAASSSYRAITLESHSESSTDANQCYKVNAMSSEYDFYKAGNVTTCELGKSSFLVSPFVEAEIGCSSPGDVVSDVQGSSVTKDGDRLQQIFLPSESGYDLKPEPNTSKHDLLSERVLNPSSFPSVASNEFTAKNPYDKSCDIKFVHQEQTLIGLRCSPVPPEERQLTESSDSEENYHKSKEVCVEETCQQNINLAGSVSSPPTSPDSTQNSVIEVKRKGNILTDQNGLDVDGEPQVVPDYLLNKTFHGSDDALSSDKNKTDDEVHERKPGMLTGNVKDEYEALTVKEIEESIIITRRDEDKSDAPARKDKIKIHNSVTNNEEDFGVQIKEDEESFDAPRGDIQEDDADNVPGNIEMNSDNPSRKDEEWYDAPSIKDEENTFSLNGEDKEYSSVPIGDDEVRSCTQPIKQDTDAPTEQNEQIDAQTKNLEVKSIVLHEKDENGSISSLIKHDEFYTLTGNTEDEYNILTTNNEESSDIPLTKDEDGSHGFQEEPDIPTRRDDKNHNAPPVKDEERSDDLAEKVKQELICLDAQHLNKTDTQQEGKIHEMKPCFLIRKDEVGENDGALTGKEVGESNERNEELTKTGKYENKITISIVIDEDCSTPREKDERVYDASLMKNEDGPNDSTRPNKSHDHLGKDEDYSFDTIRKTGKESDSPNTRDEAVSHVPLIKNESGCNSPPVTDEELSVASPQNEENDSDALLMKDEEWSNNTISEPNPDPQTRRDKDRESYCMLPEEDQKYSNVLTAKYEIGSDATLAKSNALTEVSEVSLFKTEEASEMPTGIIEEESSTSNQQNEPESEQDEEGSDTQPGKAQGDCFTPIGEDEGEVVFAGQSLVKYEKESDVSIIKDIIECPGISQKECCIPIEGNDFWSHISSRKDAQIRKDEKETDPPMRLDEIRSNVLLPKDEEKSLMPAESMQEDSSTMYRQNEQVSGNAAKSDNQLGNNNGNYSTPTEDGVESDVMPVQYEEESDSLLIKDETPSHDTIQKNKESDIPTTRNEDLYHATSIKAFDAQTRKNEEEKDKEGCDMPAKHIEEESNSPARRNKEHFGKDECIDTLTGNIEETFHVPTKIAKVSEDVSENDDENDLTGKVEEKSNILSRRDDKASDAALGKKKYDSDAPSEKDDFDAPPGSFEQQFEPFLINDELNTPNGDAEDSDIFPSKYEGSSEAMLVKDKENSPTGIDHEDAKDERNSESPIEKAKEQSLVPNIQMQFLQVLQSVSSGQNLSMLQEVMESRALGSDTHILECIKEESSEDELLAEQSPILSADNVDEIKNLIFSTQDYLECVGRLQDHADVLDDVRKDLLIGESNGTNMEELQIQVDEIQSLESQVYLLAGVLTEDMEKAKLLLNAPDENIPAQIRKDLSSTYEELQQSFTTVCQECAEKTQSLFRAMENSKKVYLESTYQKHLADLDMLVGLIQKELNIADMDFNTCDVEALKCCIQRNKDAESNLHQNVKLKLEDVTFAIQSFISEHAHLLSPAQSSCLLKCLSGTQRTFRDQMDKLVAMRSTLDVLLDTKEKEDQKKLILERQQEIADKLEEVCDSLTLTENRLIGHQQQASNAECVTDLQQYQQEHQALQKDVLTNATALNEVITSTKRFLEENRSKLTAEQIADIETKLEEAKSKAKLIQKQAEESRKDLEKVVTTAIKQESEKAAAVEHLEESKNKIESLLGWISNIGDQNERSIDETDLISKDNGNLPEETLDKSRKEKKDDANGNNLLRSESDFDGQSDACMDIDKQYERVKAHHQEILSQQQDLIMATQSAQALLDKQADVLSPQEKEKLEKNILELKGRYNASLTQAEQQMKQVQCVQEELKKFQDDCKEFEDWLKQAEGEVEHLGGSAGSLKILNDKLVRQKSFSEDVISHKGDLRFITISGQKVLDVAKACGVADPVAKNNLMQVDTSGTCSAVKDKLDSAASRYKTLHSQCNQLGNNLKDVVDKYKKYDDSSSDLLKWLGSSEEEARKQQSEAIAAEPQILQTQLEDTKALQGQMSGHQTAIDTLRKTADSLISSDGNLLSNIDEIQETVDDIVERYDNLSKSVSDRNEKLQMTLTRSMSVQDGLDEMMGWMEGVETSVKENGTIPLDSASITDMLSKETAIEQDIASRQSSIAAMKSKVTKFVETADPTSAALLQSKMDALSQRFLDTCDKHKQKVSRLEQLKDKVEQFEKVAENVQQFVMKRSQDLHETDGPGKTFEELSELTQKTKAEMAEHASNLEKLQTLSKELCEMSKDGNKAVMQSKMDNLSNIFSTFKDTLKEKEEEVSSCQDLLGEFRSAASALSKWLEETNEKVPVVQKSCSAKSLEKDLQIITGLLEEWTSKGPAVQDLNNRGSSLCSHIAILTSPAKAKIPNKTALTNGGGPASHSYLTNKELMTIQQNMSFVNEGYSCLGDTLKSRAAELNGSVRELKDAKKETENMMTWLEDMKKTAASWKNGATEKDAVKTQLEQQKVFEEDMKQKKEQLHKLREKLIDLIETHPNSQEADKWKQMLAEIDAAWADISGSALERKQHLEQSNKNLDIVQSTQLQLGQWLSEKEMMMSVLGPLSIDPNMLKMQKQQVQILQNEFKSRKPQFEQLKEAASAILNSSDNQDPSNGKLVREQLTTVTEKWQGLIGQLDQRDALIDQAAVKTGQFQELLRTLGQTTAQLEDQLSGHQASSTQPDAVKKQLEDVHNISVQLREEKGKLKEAEAVHAELTAMVTEDYLKADLDRQLETVSKPLRQLEERAAKQIEQLNSTFASSQQFHQTSKDFQSWLAQKLQDQSKPQPISAKVDVLEKTLDEHNNLQVALREEEATYSSIAGEGEMLLQNTDGAEKLALQGQLSLLSSNWQEVKKSSDAQGEKLKTALQRAKTFEEHVEKLHTWVKECEAKEGRVKLAVDPVAVEDAVVQVKALQKDVDKHRGMVEQMNNAAGSLLEVADADTDEVKKEAASISKRVDCLLEGLQNKRESLEKISHTVKEFNEDFKETKAHLEGAKKLLDAYESQGVQAYSSKNLTNMKAQQKSLEGLQNQVEHLTSLAKTLVVDLPDADGVTDLLLQADSIEKEYSSLNKKLEETCQVLESKLQGIGQFQNSIREMFTRFTDLDDELDNMAPVDLDLVVLKEQQENIERFLAQLEALMVNTADAGDGCKRMLETDSSPDLLGLKRDLDALSKQCGKLVDRAKGRERQVQSTLLKLEEFCGKLQHVEDQLCKAGDKETSQGAVGMETDIINQQLEVFKAFQKEDIDPLQTQLQDINSISQGLIQNAARGTNTKKLEDDLEKVNTKWNTLNKKIAERSAQLHEALLHCGRFHDALDSLLSWLTDTEELMANQKPPSAEFKVVKAQIQEQKLLQRLLDDRKPTVELIKSEGGKVAELAESVDKEKVAKEVQSLGQRWDTLLKKAENRHKQLQSILVVTQQFHETLEPLSDWLAATEKRLSNSEPVGTETSKLEEQISHHKTIEEEIMNRSKDLFHAVSLGQMLKAVSSVDDKDFVQSKLDATQAAYIELQERCRRKAELLQQALANAQLFGEDEVALMNWLSEAHARLKEVSVEDHIVDTLEKQMAEQLALHNDIELRKKNVDIALFNGMELLKQTTGDEVVVIQGKLDGIKTKYAEITSMSENVVNTLERVLSLSTKLHQTHDDLSTWLVKAEAQVSSYVDQEPIGEQLTQAQNIQKTLLKETKDKKAAVDKLNELSTSLLDLIPWHTREGLDKLVTEDNERYRAVCDSITQQVDRINADILKSQQFEDAADSELAWLTDAERKLLSMGGIKLGQDQTAAQLQAHKAFSMDIMRHRDSVDAIVKTGKSIMSSKKTEEKELLKAKTQTLVEKYGAVSQLNSERSLQLERAQSLASQFWETYEELSPWLQETLKTFNQLPPPAIEYETLKQQQEELRQMRELIAEHKPHIDKMNKTGPQLLELSPEEGLPIREKYTTSEQLYTKLKSDVKQRAAELDEAISKSTQFHDKIDPMLESLERIAERLHQPPSISAEVDKIKEQITENRSVSVDLEKLQPSFETLKQRGEEMIARSKDRALSAKAVRDKMDHMVFLWSDIQVLLDEREAKLLDVMDLAERFWCDHCTLIATIKDTQDLLRELEEPGVDPSVVKQQQEFVEGFKEEIDGLQEELDSVRNQGSELMTACGEPDKPVIKKSIDEVNSAWENLNKTWKERVDRLEDAMQSAVQFQDGLQGMFDWVDILESKLDSMSPVGTDLETVKQQIVELKEFKVEAYQLQIEMERLNHQAGLLLKKVTEESDRCAIQEPMYELKMLWGNLDEKIISRQHKLEGGLLALGQFQHALDELLAWMNHTEELLNEQRKAGGDPKAIEIELAKHHVLQIDVLAHKSTVETVNKAGNDLVESSAGEEASCLRSKLENLDQRWKAILEKAEQRKQQLESALLQAQGFHGEVEDMLQWLKDTERQLLASKAVGGLPDTAREQLNVHLELCSALEIKEELYKELMSKGQQLLAMTPEGNTEQDLNNLKDKWEAVQAKVAERKVKLEEALTLATDFHNSLQDFINWLTQAEQTLNMVSPASLILETSLFQIDEHKVFVTEVNSHRDDIIELDKTGTQLKYFSQKQDVVLIKNLLLSVQGRWEKLVQRSVERGRVLDDARKRAKQFHENWSKLIEWLDDCEKTLDSEVEIANEPDKIKKQLSQHKEFQKALGSKHSVYDTTSRTGRALKDKTSLQDDNQKLDDMLSELRDKWDTVCGKSIERQNKLEEALLFSGQFKDALQALIDWLYKVEPQMAEDQPVHGDIDLILNLIDNHKVFQKELGKKTVSVQALKRSARELIDSSHDDSSWVKVQIQDLSTRWETVCNLSVSKQTRLEQALCQAEEFHSTVHILLEWLAEAEQSLRFHGSLPDDEEALRALIDQHKEFMKKLEEKRVALNKAISLGEAILSICHPDSITTIKHWNTIIKARFEEVQAWARQHQQRLAAALSEFLATQDLLENLLTWLQWAESNLSDKDKEVLPQEIQEIKSLIAEHQTFMEEMTRKQPDVDKITKTHKRKAALEPQIHSQIPVLDKGRAGRKRSPTQTMYASATQAPIETKNPRVNLLVSKWQHVWLLALDRRRKLNDALDRLEELKEFANFDFDVWRKRYMRWMNHKKSRVMDFFRRIDKDQDGKVTRQEFIEGILSSKFPTSRLEMSAVADIFDRDGDGYIDYYEFVAALHPNKDAYKPLTDADKIEDEVTRQVAKCKCPKRFQVEQIGANKYRFYLGNQFGDSQQLRLVRILRSTVMVRVGGGWMALDEFLVKNDPCRVHHHGSKMLRSESNSSITQSPIGWQISNFLSLLHEPTSAKGRTNMELREKFIVPEGTTQVMASFRYRGRRSRPSSRAASPNRSISSQSCVIPSNPPVNSTPKTCQHISRNYDKPWLTNSKPSTPIKSSDSFGSPGSSSETTPVQGSKLRLPGYLSGKGFQSSDEGTLINAAVLKARGHVLGDSRKNSSRPGSKAGSRGSSRRGSDASDFDISDIQSVCSDASETVGEGTRTTPRSVSRQQGGKPSKIPTPQRRNTPTSKLAKGSKR
ncbi:dystonin isoform 8-T8 [Syngnathus typhle]